MFFYFAIKFNIHQKQKQNLKNANIVPDLKLNWDIKNIFIKKTLPTKSSLSNGLRNHFSSSNTFNVSNLNGVKEHILHYLYQNT